MTMQMPTSRWEAHLAVADDLKRRLQVVISLDSVRTPVQPYLDVLIKYGFDLQHLLGFAIYVIGDQFTPLGQQHYGQAFSDRATHTTYLAHEMLSVNPVVACDQVEFQRLVGTAHGAMEIILPVIRGQLLNAVRNPNLRAVRLERYLGNNAAILSVEVPEDFYGAPPRLAANCF